MPFKTRVSLENDIGDDVDVKSDGGRDADVAEATPDERSNSESSTKAEEVDEVDDSEPASADYADETAGEFRRPRRWLRILVLVVLPLVAMLLAGVAGYLKWQDASMRGTALARIESVQAAKDTTVAILAYRPDTVEQNLDAAAQLLTGSFRDDYEQLRDNVVIPGAKQQLISTSATVPAAAVISASANHAVVLVYVNQTTAVGSTAPTDLQSSVRVSMEKINGRWLMSEFTPE